MKLFSIAPVYMNPLDYSDDEDHIRELGEKIGWYTLSSQRKIPDNLIIEFANNMNWRYLSTHSKLSDDVIRKVADRLDWKFVSHYQALSINIMEEFIDRLDWFYIARNKYISNDTIMKFIDKFDINNLFNDRLFDKEEIINYCRQANIKDINTLSMIYKNQNQLCSDLGIKNRKPISLEDIIYIGYILGLTNLATGKLPEMDKYFPQYKTKKWDETMWCYSYTSKQIMERGEYSDIDWDKVSKYGQLTDDVIHRYVDDIDWLLVSIYQKLSSNFIRKYYHLLDWNAISSCQALSEAIIREFADKVNWYNIINNNKIKLSKEFLEEFKPFIDRDIKKWNARTARARKDNNIKEVI